MSNITKRINNALLLSFLFLLVVYAVLRINNVGNGGGGGESAAARASGIVDVDEFEYRRANVSEVAFASVAVGPKARFTAAALLLSFVRNSAFDGPFYLITDKPEYYDDMQAEFRRYASRVVFLKLTASAIGDMPLPVLPLDTVFKVNRYGQVSWARYNDYKRTRLEIKWLKTRLFEFMPPHRYVVFMDSDIVIGRAMQPFVEHCKALQARPNGQQAIVTLFTDIGNTGSLYHTGVVWFSRKHSRQLLRVWGTTISRGAFPSDQRAIRYSIEQLEAAERVAFAPVYDDNFFFAFINGTVVDGGLRFTFLHTTSYRLENPVKFGFTNETLVRYFRDSLNTPWRTWQGASSMSRDEHIKQLQKQIELKKADIERQEQVAFKRPTVIAKKRADLLELLRELQAVLQLDAETEETK